MAQYHNNEFMEISAYIKEFLSFDSVFSWVSDF